MIELLQESWGRQVVPVQLPIVDQHGFHGVVDLVTMKAYFYKPDGDGRGRGGRDSRGDARQMRKLRMRRWWSWSRKVKTS